MTDDIDLVTIVISTVDNFFISPQTTPGTSQGMSTVRTERSEVYRKQRFLFLSSDGNTLIKVIMTITLITVKQGEKILRM